MTIERPGVAYDLRGGALGLRPGAGGEEISGVEKIIMTTIAVFVFSELQKAYGIFKDAHEVKSANLIGVMMIAYKNTNLFLL